MNWKFPILFLFPFPNPYHFQAAHIHQAICSSVSEFLAFNLDWLVWMFFREKKKIDVLLCAAKRHICDKTPENKLKQKQWTCNMAGFDSYFQCSVFAFQKSNTDSEYSLQCQKLTHKVGEGEGRGRSVLQMEDCVHYSDFNIACIHKAMPFCLGQHHKHTSCLAGWMKGILQSLYVRPLAWRPRYCKSSADKPHLLKETGILTSLTQAKPSNLGK